MQRLNREAPFQSLSEFRQARIRGARERALQWLEGFQLCNIASHAERGEVCEIWRCSKPESGVGSFDMAITRNGLAALGNVRGMVFSSGFGIQELAAGELSAALSKLDPRCAENEFDPEGFLHDCITGLWIHIDQDEGWPDDSRCKDAVAAIGRHRELACGPALAGLVVRELCAFSARMPLWPEHQERIGRAIAYVEAASAIRTLDGAHELVQANEEFVDIALEDMALERPTDALLTRLAVLQEAAARIVEATAAEQDAADNDNPQRYRSAA